MMEYLKRTGSDFALYMATKCVVWRTESLHISVINTQFLHYSPVCAFWCRIAAALGNQKAKYFLACMLLNDGRRHAGKEMKALQYLEDWFSTYEWKDEFMGFEHAVAHLYLGYFFRDTPLGVVPAHIGGVVPTQYAIEKEKKEEIMEALTEMTEDEILAALQSVEDPAEKKGLNQRHSTENPSGRTSSLFEAITKFAHNIHMAALNSKRRIRLRHGHGRQGFFKKITALAPNMTRALRRRPYRGPTLYYEDEALGVDIDKAQSWLLRIEDKCDNDTMFSIGSAIDHSSRNILGAGYSFCRLENFVDYGHCERMEGYRGRYYPIPEEETYYEKEIHRKKTLENSLYWHSLAAKNGHLPSMWEAAYIEDYLNPTPDARYLVKWYGKIAETDPKAARMLGQTFFHGHRGLDEDLEKALYWFNRAAELGDSDSCFYLGLIFEHGEVVKQDMSQAIEFYQKSRTRSAMDKLGVIFELGAGVKQDYEQAASYYRSRIANPHDGKRFSIKFEGSAQLNLGKMLLSGKVAPLDGESASEMLGGAWHALPYQFGQFYEGFNLLEDGRYEVAESKIPRSGEREEFNEGVLDALAYLDDNPRLEEVFFLDSRARRDADYLYNAGRAFLCGEGVPRDNHKAFEFLRLAAKLEHGESQWILAKMYELLADGVHFSGFHYETVTSCHDYRWMRKARENNGKLSQRTYYEL